MHHKSYQDAKGQVHLAGIVFSQLRPTKPDPASSASQEDLQQSLGIEADIKIDSKSLPAPTICSLFWFPSNDPDPWVDPKSRSAFRSCHSAPQE